MVKASPALFSLMAYAAPKRCHVAAGLNWLALAQGAPEPRARRDAAAKALVEFETCRGLCEAHGFTDAHIADALAGFPAAGPTSLASGRDEAAVMARRHALGIHPVYRMVDSCAAEFAAATPYYYSTYEPLGSAGIDLLPALEERTKERVVAIGSGPIRIGQGIEFDYGCVHAVNAIRAAGKDAVLINNNPETVSTDFDTSDRLYFEPLILEHVAEVLLREQLPPQLLLLVRIAVSGGVLVC